MARKIVRMAWLPRIWRTVSNMRFSPARIRRVRLAMTQSAGVAARGTELFDNAVGEFGSRRCRIRVLVFQIHRLPLERTELMKRLHFDPLDVLHRRHEARDAFDIRRVVG